MNNILKISILNFSVNTVKNCLMYLCDLHLIYFLCIKRLLKDSSLVSFIGFLYFLQLCLFVESCRFSRGSMLVALLWVWSVRVCHIAVLYKINYKPSDFIRWFLNPPLCLCHMRLEPPLTRQTVLRACSEVNVLWQARSRDTSTIGLQDSPSVQGYLRGQALDGEKLFDIYLHVISYLTLYV